MKKFLKMFFDRSFWLFLCVGAFNTLLSMGLSFLILHILYLTKVGSRDSYYYIASGISFVIASISAFILNRKFTFQHTGSVLHSFLRFAIVIGVCYLIAFPSARPLTKHLLKIMALPKIMNSEIIDMISYVVAQVIFTALNYLGQRFFAFRKEPKKAETQNIQ